MNENLFDAMRDVTDALMDFNGDQSDENERRVDEAVDRLTALKAGVKGSMLKLADSIIELAIDFTD